MIALSAAIVWRRFGVVSGEGKKVSEDVCARVKDCEAKDIKIRKTQSVWAPCACSVVFEFLGWNKN
jgi:hypothetical protein